MSPVKRTTLPTPSHEALTMSRTPHLLSSTPSITAGGNEKTILQHIPAKQPVRQAWTKDQLERERAIALAYAVDNSTCKYSSALNSYLDFVKNHSFPVEPTPDTLSFYVVYMSHHVKPASVDTYLFGDLSAARTFFPRCQETLQILARHSHPQRL